MAVTDVCTLRAVGRYQGQNIVNTLHYRIETQTSNDKTVLANLAQVWLSAFSSAWYAAHSEDYELIGIKTFGKTGTSKTPGYLAVGEPGTVIGDGAPAFVCRTITLYTADIKHRRRGRLMLSGTPVAQLDAADGSLTLAAKGLLDTIGAITDEAISGTGDEFMCGIPAAGADSWQNIVDYKSRETPSCVTSRRIRQFLIG